MSKESRTANQEEMIVNQQSYGRGSEVVEINEKSDLNYIEKVGDARFNENGTTLIRSDKDNLGGFDLQTHNTYSGLDITTYSVYSGFKEPGKEPNRVIVGVAGTDLSTSTDMEQNLNLALSRSSFNHLTDTDLQKLKNKTRRVRTNEGEWIEIKNTDANLYYEIEMRQKVQALQKYRENGVPITMVGDSKGGEDAAYLALSFVKSTLKTPEGTCPVYEKADFTAVNLYLTNPKGIRVSDEDYQILEKMASQGKVTVEVVYPEILSKFLIDQIWREIPYSAKIYTVPNQLRSIIDNHKIGEYEENVYQGFGGNYKFQCDQEPTEIRELSDSADPALGMQVDVKVGYRYVVSRITDKSGKSMSVNDYFFEEQIQKMARLRDEMRAREVEYSKIKNEPILEYFTAEVDRKKYSLKEKHKQWIRNATPFEMYYQERKDLIKTQDVTRYLLERDYEALLESHVDSESVNYKGAVKNRVERYITAYQERVDNEMMRLRQKAEQIDTDVIPSIREAQSTFIKSQEQIQLIIEKRN